MYYYKENLGKLTIEIEGVWNGDELIYINGQVASKQKAVLKTEHYIRLSPEEGSEYIIVQTGTNLFLRRTCKIYYNHDLIKPKFILPNGDKPLTYQKKN